MNVCTVHDVIPTRTLTASHFTSSARTLAATSTCFYSKLSLPTNRIHCEVRQNTQYALESATNAPWEKNLRFCMASSRRIFHVSDRDDFFPVEIVG